MPHPPAWFPRTTFLSVKRASVTERIFLQVWWQFSQSVVSPFPSFGGGCVKSKHQVFFDILYKKGNALYLFILVFLLLSFGK